MSTSSPFSPVASQRDPSITTPSPDIMVGDIARDLPGPEPERQLTPPPPGPRSNVIASEAYRAEIGAALASIARILARTLGPHGDNTFIYSPHGEHHPTKDGYTVLRSLSFVQELPCLVLDIVRGVSRRIVTRVGDGSTSAVIAADRLHRELDRARLTSEYPPRAVAAAINAVAQALAEGVAGRARPVVSEETVDEKLLSRVASISANNDPETGAIVASIYTTPNTRVTVEDGGPHCPRTQISKRQGFRVVRGYAHSGFCERDSVDGGVGKARLEKVAVLVSAGRVDQQFFRRTVVPAMNASFNSGLGFALIAPSFDSGVLEQAVTFKQENSHLGILFIDHPVSNARHNARLGDLAAMLGARLVTEETAPTAERPGSLTPEEKVAFDTALGWAESITSSSSETLFICRPPSEEVERTRRGIRERIASLSDRDQSEAMSETIAELRARDRALSGAEFVLRAGGETHQERMAVKDLLDDATLACEAAIESGITEGMGMPILRQLAGPTRRADLASVTADAISRRTAMNQERAGKLAERVIAAFEQAYRSVFMQVLENGRYHLPEAVLSECLDNGKAFDAAASEFYDPDELRVSCPAKTDREIVLGASSIVAELIASSQTVMPRPILAANQD